MDNKRPHLTFKSWSEQCGGIYAIKIMGKKIVVLSSWETLTEALLKKGKDFGGRSKQYYRFNLITEGKKGISNASLGPFLNHLRKTVHCELKLYDIKTGKESFEALNVAILSDLVGNITSKNGLPFSPKELIQSAILNVMTALLFGMKYETESQEFKIIWRTAQLVKSTLAIGGSGALLDALPWLRFFGNSAYKDCLKIVDLTTIVFQQIKKKIKADLKKGEKSKGIIHAFFKYNEDNQMPFLDDPTLRCIMGDLLFGGITTTTSTLMAFLNFMVHNQDVQETLRHEVINIIGTDNTPSLANRADMPYTKAVILELTRITSILPLAIPHITLVDSSIAGYTIPKDTQVFMNTYALHHDEHFWQDPNVFRPERYLDKVTGWLLPPDHAVRKHTLPFGAGPRVCLGETLAYNRLFLFITTLIQKFHIEADNTKPLVPCDPESFEMGFLLTPQDYTLRMRPLT